MFGKTVSDFQSDVIVDDDAISGVLEYTRDYTGFSEDPTEQAGYFLALKFAAPEGWTTTVEIVNGTSGPVILDSNMNWVGKIDGEETGLIVTSTDGTVTISKTYSMNFTLSETAVLSITTPPTKVNYVEGEELDLAGLVITGTYHNGSTTTTNIDAAIEAGLGDFAIEYQTEGATAFTAGDTKVFIIWSGQEMEQAVTVTSATE